jgi:hypothetical protein
MPRVPDASMMTQFRRASATVTTDPVKKSRVFVAPIKNGYLTSIVQASEVRRYTVSSVLAFAAWKSPDFKGRIFLK